MSEDVSATMRVGITVILVAALVAVVLNLMVMSNSLLNGGQTTLQSGIDSVSQQEFTSYDNTKVSGTQVNTALSLFQGRDVAILIQTQAYVDNDKSNNTDTKGYAFNYGALITSNGQASQGTSPGTGNYPAKIEGTATAHGASNFISAQAKTAYLVGWSEEAAPTGDYTACVRNSGASNFTALLHNSYGLTDSNYDLIGTTELGNSQYLLSSARFSSVLIKDPNGSIIGILFRQIS